MDVSRGLSVLTVTILLAPFAQGEQAAKPQLPGIADTATSGLNKGNNLFLVRSGTDEKTAYLRFGTRLADGSPWGALVSLETPYDEKTDPAILGDFDGFTNSTNIQLDLRHVAISPRSNETETDDAIAKLCSDFISGWRRNGGACTSADVFEATKNRKDPDRLCETTQGVTCEEVATAAKVRFVQESRRIERRLDAGAEVGQIGTVLNLSGRYGIQEFKYRGPTSLQANSATENPFSLSASYYRVHSTYALGAGLTYQESFTESSKRQICSPVNDVVVEGALECIEARVGPPTNRDRRIAFLEANIVAPGRIFAISPRLSYDFESNATGIDLPIFFLKELAGSFSGGMRIGWQSDDDELTSELFIGRSFSFF